MNQRRSQLTIVGIVFAALVVIAGLLWTQGRGVQAPLVATPAAAESPVATPVAAAPASPLAAPQPAAQPASPVATAAPVAAAAAVTATPVITPTVVTAPAAPVTATDTVSASTAISPVAAAPTTEPVVVTFAEAANPPAGPLPTYGYAVVKTYPHDPEAFTQGLQYVDGVLYEGTGLYGKSSLRRVDLATGDVLQKVDVPEAYFGEGIVVVDDRIIQLTWESNVAFVYDRETFTPTGQFAYPTEGWGITFDGTDLWMSDGSSTLFRRDPTTFAELGRVDVQVGGDRVLLLNELEYVAGAIWANVWQTNSIVIVDPATGDVVGVVDLTGLLDGVTLTRPPDVLNGIAYDAAGDRLFVTGKLWPAIFEIRLVRR